MAQPQRVWITEFSTQLTMAVAPMAQLPALRKHPPLDLIDGTAKRAELLSETKYIRIVSEVQCAYSTTGDATINDILLPRLHVEYMGTAADDTFVSVIAAP
jgi:hypothetical protein